MKNNHPANAIKIVFQPINQGRVKYYIWPKDGGWVWSAQGNSGREVTQEAAMRAAREWILLGVSGLKSHGEYRGVLNASQ